MMEGSRSGSRRPKSMWIRLIRIRIRIRIRNTGWKWPKCFVFCYSILRRHCSRYGDYSSGPQRPRGTRPSFLLVPPLSSGGQVKLPPSQNCKDWLYEAKWNKIVTWSFGCSSVFFPVTNKIFTKITCNFALLIGSTVHTGTVYILLLNEASDDL